MRNNCGLGALVLTFGALAMIVCLACMPMCHFMQTEDENVCLQRCLRLFMT